MNEHSPITIPLELKALFLRETSENLQKAKKSFAQLQEAPDNHQNLEDVGHFFHRLAGTAHSLEYPTLGRLSMICENLAQLIQEGMVSDRSKAIEIFSDGLAAVEEILQQNTSDSRNKAPIPIPLSNRSTQNSNKFRIMVIDDDPFSASLIDNCLRSAGFISSCCTKPEKTLQALDEERPDLLILDVDMPEMNGFDLCRLIRKHPAMTFTPVIFVTRKGDVEQRVHGLEVGGNDYISKPFDPQELVARVRSHLQRLSALQDMAIRDGLTRCFNHKYFKIRLGHEIERAKRYNVPFCLVMLDIDFFKKVNDTWGHPAGDAVLIHLANIIAASVRSTDCLARYGGEEFGIMLIEAGEKEAAIIANRLRERVAQETVILPEHPEIKIHITVSVGIAEFEPRDSLESLLERADSALYLAKARGRNRVETALHSEDTKADIVSNT